MRSVSVLIAALVAFAGASARACDYPVAESYQTYQALGTEVYETNCAEELQDLQYGFASGGCVQSQVPVSYAATQVVPQVQATYVQQREVFAPRVRGSFNRGFSRGGFSRGRFRGGFGGGFNRGFSRGFGGFNQVVVADPFFGGFPQQTVIVQEPVFTPGLVVGGLVDGLIFDRGFRGRGFGRSFGRGGFGRGFDRGFSRGGFGRGRFRR